MTFKSLFLPIGLVLAIAIALSAPGFGVFLKNEGAMPWFVVTIFLVNGFQFKLRDAQLNRHLVMAIAFGAIISLAIGPLLGWSLAHVMDLPTSLALGLIIMSAMPPTLSSGIVITEVSGGHVPWAIVLTISLNALGVFVIPFTLKMCLDSHQGVDLQALPLLIKLSLLVILPFLIGLLFKPLSTFTSRHGWDNIIGYLPSTCVILTVLASLSASSESFLAPPLHHLPTMAMLVTAAHGALFVCARMGSRLLKLTASQTKAFTFVNSQKTLPIALSVLTAMGITSGATIITCLLFHFSQLIMDSFLASYWAQRTETSL